MPWRVELVGDPLGCGEDRLVLAGRDDVHVGRRDLARPGEPELVEGALRDRGHRARGADAVGAHRHRDELAVLVEHPEVERVGVTCGRAGRCGPSRCRARPPACPSLAVRAGVAVADLGGLDGAVGGEVAADHQVDHVAAVDVGAGHPARALHDPGVDEEADAGLVLLPQHPGTDVALGQSGVLLELGLVEGLDLDRLHLALEPLLVDLAVAGHADGERLAGAVGVLEHDQDVLERVGGGPGAVVTRELLVEVVDQRVDRGRVRGLLGVRGGRVVVRRWGWGGRTWTASTLAA